MRTRRGRFSNSLYHGLHEVSIHTRNRELETPEKSRSGRRLYERGHEDVYGSSGVPLILVKYFLDIRATGDPPATLGEWTVLGVRIHAADFGAEMFKINPRRSGP